MPLRNSCTGIGLSDAEGYLLSREESRVDPLPVCQVRTISDERLRISLPSFKSSGSAYEGMEKNRGQGDHMQISRCFESQSDFVFNCLTDDD